MKFSGHHNYYRVAKIFTCVAMLSVWQLSYSVETNVDPSGQVENVESPEDKLLKGQRLLDIGELEQAERYFSEVLLQVPDHAQALYLSGVVAIRTNNYKQGTALISRAIQIDPGNVVYLSALASMYEFLHREADALKLNQRIIDLSADDSQEYQLAQRNVGYLEATLLARGGKISAAREKFLRLSEQYPDDFMIQYSLGVALLFEQRLAEAELALRKVIDINPGFEKAYDTLATLYEKEGRLDQTYAMLERLVSINPNGVVAQGAQTRMYIIEGRLLMAEGNEADAQLVFEKALNLMPDNPEVLYHLGVIYDKASDWQGVVDVSETLLERFPGRPDVRLRLAKAYVFLQRYEDGVKELEGVVATAPQQSPEAREAQMQLQRLMVSPVGLAITSKRRDQQIFLLQEQLVDDPVNPDLLSELVTLLIQQGRWHEARVSAEQLLAVSQPDGITYTSLALIYDKLGLFDLAIKPYAYGVSLEENADTASRIVPALLLVVAKNQYTQGHYDDALRFLEAIVVNEPGNVEALFYIGLAYFNRGSTVKAIEAYERVLQITPANVNARLNLAMSYHRLKQEERAIEEFSNALQYSADEQLTAQIKAQMQALEHSIRGFSGGFSFSLAYDNNSNLNNDNPLNEYRTDLSPQIYYRYKATNGLRWLLSTSPTYSSYHNGEYDFLNTLSSVTASVSRERVTLSAGTNYQVSRGLVNSARSSNNLTFFGEWLGRYKLPMLFEPMSSERVLTNLSGRASYSNFNSLTSRFFGAYIYATSLSFNQPVDGRTMMAMTYRYTLSDNRYVEGSDYAYRSHGVDLRLDRGLTAGVAANAGVSYTRMNYLYPDSTTGFTRYRRSSSRSVFAGLSYQFHPLIRLYSNVTRTINATNLPVGVILNAQDVIEGQQSPTLGDYSRYTFLVGLSMNI